MAEQLLLINPRRRRRKRKTSRRKRNPAPVTRRKRRPSVKSNPGRRSYRRRSYRPKRRHYRRNPIKMGGMGGLVSDNLIPAAVGATGALALDILYGIIPLPENIKMGNLRHAVKGAAAIGMGMLAGMVVNKSMAKSLTNGALTVVLHQAMAELTQKFLPNLTLGEYGEINDLGYTSYAQGADGMGYYLPSGMPEAEASAMNEYMDGMAEGEKIYL